MQRGYRNTDIIIIITNGRPIPPPTRPAHAPNPAVKSMPQSLQSHVLEGCQ
jgi:hypothetical protein